MSGHVPSGRRALGLGLGMLTAMFWGTMPVVLKLLVNWLDVYTLTWARFVIAGTLMLLVVLRRHGWRSLLRARRRPALVLVCVTGLTGNYLLYQSGLRFVSPDTAQIVIQLSPIFVLFGGLLLYREPFGRLQWLGFATLICGMVLFLNPHYEELLTDLGQYAAGVLLILVAALVWAIYMLAQKQLLVSMPPETILVLIYLFGALVLLVPARPAVLAALEGYQIILLVAVSLMTMISYLSFGTAMNHVEASRLGVVVALTPLLTVGITAIAATLIPELLSATHLNPLSILGAAGVVAGSMLTAVSKAPLRATTPAAGAVGVERTVEAGESAGSSTLRGMSDGR